MILYLILVLCCVYLIPTLWRKRKYGVKELKPPELSGRYPIFGHSLRLIGDRKNILDLVKDLSSEALEKGGVITWHIGLVTIYVLTDPDDCIKVANECLKKDPYYSFAKPLLGNGLILAEGAVWKAHRKMMSPAFRLQSLNSFLIVFNRQARHLVNQFEPHLERGPFNIHKYIRQNNLESICMTSFGADVKELDGIHHEYLEAVNEFFVIFTERFQKFWLHNDYIYSWSNLKKREDLCCEKIKTFSKIILAKRKAEMKKNGRHTELESFTPFMSYLLELSKDSDMYSEEDILYETNTMVAGGYDTSTTTVILIILLLGSNEEVQNKVYEELREVFENSNRDVEKDDLVKLVYLEAVIKETLRLYSLAPLLPRRVEKDIRIKNYTIKAGNSVGLLFWGMHRGPIWGPDAAEFRPGRWLDGSLPRNPHAFGGFSLGKRDCIGKTYAMMSIKTVISHIVRRYKITADINKLKLEVHGALQTVAGQIISIEERMTTDSNVKT